MSFFKNKYVITLLAVIVIAAVVAVLSRLGNNAVSNVVNAVITPVQSLLAKAAVPIDNIVRDWRDLQQYKDENTELKRDNAALKRENRSVEEYKKENDRLRRLLGIQERLEGCKTVAAKVIGYEPNNWFDTMVIDKGTNEGIAVSDVVISADGVVGRISEVGLNWSRISTIINADHAVGVRITRTGDIGVLEGDNQLARENRCKLDYIVQNASILEGDILETSGEGGIYPPGLIVGKVSALHMDSTGRIREAVVEPAVDLNSLHEVLVMTEWTVTEERPVETPRPSETPGMDENAD